MTEPTCEEVAAAITKAATQLRDPDEDLRTRWRAAQTLGRLGTANAPALSALIVALQHGNETARRYAVKTLISFGGVDDRVVDALIGALQDDFWEVRSDSIDALGDLGARPIAPLSEDQVRRVVPALTAMLLNPEYEQWQILRALGKIGSREAVPALIQALTLAEDEDVADVGWISFALGEIRDPAAIPVLTEALQRDFTEPFVREHIQEALDKIEGEEVA